MEFDIPLNVNGRNVVPGRKGIEHIDAAEQLRAGDGVANKGRVFVVETVRQRPSEVTKGVEKFGLVVPIFADGARRPSLFKPTDYMCALRDSLLKNGYGKPGDYFLMVGSVIAVSLATTVLVSMFGPIRLIMWSSSQQEYFFKDVCIDDVDGEPFDPSVHGPTLADQDPYEGYANAE